MSATITLTGLNTTNYIYGGDFYYEVENLIALAENDKLYLGVPGAELIYEDNYLNIGYGYNLDGHSEQDME